MALGVGYAKMVGAESSLLLPAPDTHDIWLRKWAVERASNHETVLKIAKDIRDWVAEKDTSDGPKE